MTLFDDGAVGDRDRLDLSRERGLAGRQRVVAGVADPAAELIRGQADVAADEALVHGQDGALVNGAHVDRVEPDPGALVDADVVADDALGDHDAAVALRVDPAAGIARTIVADRAVQDPQRPGRAESQGILHRDGAAGGLRDVAGDDHVLQGQAGVEAVADGAAADIGRDCCPSPGHRCRR